MAQLSSPPRLKGARRRLTKRKLGALLSQVTAATKALGPKTTLAELVASHVALEACLVDLTDAIDRLSLAPPSVADQRRGGYLRRAERRVGRHLAAIERRIVVARAGSIDAAILKLQLYAGLQGYALASGRGSRRTRPVEEELFSSTLADLRRMAAAEQSSDRKQPNNARK